MKILENQQKKINTSFLQKISSNKYGMPLEICKELMFYLNIMENEFTKIIEIVVALKTKKSSEKKFYKKLDKLTSKEKEIFNLVASGFSTKQIANKLFVQESTVSTHRKKIKQKLELRTNFDWFRLSNRLQIS